MGVMTLPSSNVNKHCLMSMKIESIDPGYLVEVGGTLIRESLTGNEDIPHTERNNLLSFPYLSSFDIRT